MSAYRHGLTSFIISFSLASIYIVQLFSKDCELGLIIQWKLTIFFAAAFSLSFMIPFITNHICFSSFTSYQNQSQQFKRFEMHSQNVWHLMRSNIFKQKANKYFPVDGPFVPSWSWWERRSSNFVPYILDM